MSSQRSDSVTGNRVRPEEMYAVGGPQKVREGVAKEEEEEEWSRGIPVYGNSEELLHVL